MMHRELFIEKYIPPTEIRKGGPKLWRNKYGELHGFNGQPAVIIYLKGKFLFREWWKNGKQVKTKMH